MNTSILLTFAGFLAGWYKKTNSSNKNLGKHLLVVPEKKKKTFPKNTITTETTAMTDLTTNPQLYERDLWRRVLSESSITVRWQLPTIVDVSKPWDLLKIFRKNEWRNNTIFWFNILDFVDIETSLHVLYRNVNVMKTKMLVYIKYLLDMSFSLNLYDKFSDERHPNAPTLKISII